MNASSEHAPETSTRTLVCWLAVAAIVGLGFVLRVAYYQESYGHPDEAITAEVVGHMRQSGDWDTNWAKATNLEEGFRYNQYNFSSHLFATFGFYRVVKVLPGTSSWRSEREGFFVYRFFSVLLASLVVWQTLRLAGHLGGCGAMLGAGLLVAVAVQLVQDAHYSRPEAFVTMLTLAAVGACWPRAKVHPSAVLGGAALVGLLVACKISMMLLVWLPFVPVLKGDVKARMKWGLAALILSGLFAGFILGAPGAVAHPQFFVNGVQHLMTQYAGLHPPHSHISRAPVADMIGGYYTATLGWPLILSAFFGAGVLVRRGRWVELTMVAGPVMIFAGYFSTKAVFFERNLSHVLPLFLVLAAVGAAGLVEAIGARVRAPGWAVAVAAAVVFTVCAVPGLRLTAPLLAEEFSGAGSDRHKAFEAALKKRYPGGEWAEVSLLNDGPLIELAARLKADRRPVLLRITDFNDEWNAYNLKTFTARFDAKLLADYPGNFAPVPVCTLHTYHSPHDRYYWVTGLR